MKLSQRITAITVALTLSAGTLLVPIAANASEEGKRNTAIGLGAAAAALLLTQKNKLPGIVAGAGAAYAYKKYDDDVRDRHRREDYYGYDRNRNDRYNRDNSYNSDRYNRDSTYRSDRYNRDSTYRSDRYNRDSSYNNDRYNRGSVYGDTYTTNRYNRDYSDSVDCRDQSGSRSTRRR